MLTIAQILSITCDNASNNDTMVSKLEKLLEVFPGESNRTRCFDHIVNLIAKSVIRQFDTPTVKGNEAFDDVLRELMVSAGDLERGELVMRAGESCGSEVDSDDDDMDSLVDEQEDMSETERTELDDNIQPVRCVLVKVSIASVLPWLC